MNFSKTNNYTTNITEKIRVDIGKMLLIHEFKKLFPTLTTASYENLERDLLGLISNLEIGNDVGIRNFWNLVDAMMMNFMLKDIVFNITSASFDWSLRQNIAIKDLKFTVNITEIEGFDINGRSAREVSEYLEANPQVKENLLNNSLTYYDPKDTRHLDPVVILDEGNGDFVHDGNGRLKKAILNGEEALAGYVGKKNNVSKSNHWVATSYLMRLNEEAKIDKSVKQLLEEVTSSSQNAKYELDNRVNQ